MIRGGRSYVLSPPAFSNDAKRLLVCTANTVTIFSTATGLPVLSLDGHTALVTAVIVVPASTPASKILCYCWTASLDGTIRYWDFSVPELIKIINVNLPIISMVIPSLLSQTAETNDKSPKTFAYLSVENTKEPEKEPGKVLRGQIKKCNLTNSRMAGGMTLSETKQPEIITVSSSGKYFGIQFKRKLRIWKVPIAESERAVVKKITLHHTKNMNVLAFHPTQRIVAAGDVTGRILIWRGFGDRTFADGDGLVSRKLTNNEEERPGVRGNDDADSCTTWHWHSAEVNVLFFSSDGAYLYSGGKEGVLVVWQLDTGRKKFLPRIGSPLLWFTDSPDPSLSSISCADNQIHLLKMPSMEILKSISGIKLPCSFPEMCNGLQSGIAFDCNAGLVALRTENYCIQLYSLFDDRGISEVVVCERNHQPGDEVTVVVTLAVLSLDGSMMSTAEVKLPEEGLGGLVCLKFWALGSQNKEFSLSTIVYEPHRDAGISAIAFHPTRPMAVSSSYGGDFKMRIFSVRLENKGTRLSIGVARGAPLLAQGRYLILDWQNGFHRNGRTIQSISELKDTFGVGYLASNQFNSLGDVFAFGVLSTGDTFLAGKPNIEQRERLKSWWIHRLGGIYNVYTAEKRTWLFRNPFASGHSSTWAPYHELRVAICYAVFLLLHLNTSIHMIL
ncbi:hypothetical protein NC652_016937 [Populus alba x Populus x berolinensis]|nr:hypothetical protein NC652_016937 [Populus alba x Populus x berolinensis]